MSASGARVRAGVSARASCERLYTHIYIIQPRLYKVAAVVHFRSFCVCILRPSPKKKSYTHAMALALSPVPRVLVAVLFLSTFSFSSSSNSFVFFVLFSRGRNLPKPRSSARPRCRKKREEGKPRTHASRMYDSAFRKGFPCLLFPARTDDRGGDLSESRNNRLSSRAVAFFFTVYFLLSFFSPLRASTLESECIKRRLIRGRSPPKDGNAYVAALASCALCRSLSHGISCAPCRSTERR